MAQLRSEASNIPMVPTHFLSMICNKMIMVTSTGKHYLQLEGGVVEQMEMFCILVSRLMSEKIGVLKGSSIKSLDLFLLLSENEEARERLKYLVCSYPHIIV